ncbi:tripartite tricarboxylate transporter substrate binding protein BugD [Paracoccus sp. MC1854]|uniref:tripartite tricarboxylate transporter substrate-binding protein n=1 Tax=Paracoccus sp. MC1854 TaxID=2760306 RepID=UPI001601F465|nr:tripartite tricarboxylate transporter substrate-binding protein [Paracoccus sp. MC1854]MBB1492300.1 tripartite tricarboxylate transporter substrate binding protein BugD [Paracoccus sp. MC1854]
MTIQHWSFALALAALPLGAGTAMAQNNYPTRNVTLVVPYSAGGPTDTVARLVAEPMSRALGQQIIIENIGGASGTIGAGQVARADADGYTLMLHTSAQATNDLFYTKLAYGSREAFQPIGVVSHTPMTLVGRKDLPPGTAAEALDYVRTNGEDVAFGNAGVGGPSYLCGLLLENRLETPMIMVPYGGTGPALTDLLGGQIDLICEQATNTISHIRSGAVKAYATTSAERLPSLPDLPTLAESGLEGFETTVWLGLYGPAEMPQPVIDTVVAALQEALQDPLVTERFAELATTPATAAEATPEGLQATQEAEVAKWQDLIAATGIKVD